MTKREKFLKCLNFEYYGEPMFWQLEGVAEQAVRKWCIDENYPLNLAGDSCCEFDGKIFTFPLNDQMPIPAFVPKVLSSKDGITETRTTFGSKQLCFDDQQISPICYIYTDGPLDTVEDWREMKKRFDPDDIRRLPFYWSDEYLEEINNSDSPFIPAITWGPARGIKIGYMFGFDRYMELIVEEPEILHEIFDFWADYCIAMFSKFIKKAKPDVVVIREDGMGYKASSLISPAMYRDIYKPYVRRFTDYLKANGVDLICYYSSGNLMPLIDELWDAGINMFAPVESAACMDGLEIRKRYPKMRLIGNIGKDPLAAGKAEIDYEIDNKILPLLNQGGFIPAFDDQILQDTTLENVRYCYDKVRALRPTDPRK